ncbi:MAG: T9SS type A sorting domain-containing protein, partial [Candidatus Neomarinimicrobiota bacterium]
TIRGGFSDPVTGSPIVATTDKAIIVSGQLEFKGGGCASAYTHLRYALTYADSLALNYQGTDSANWKTTADSAKNQNKHYGYGFHPRTGNGTMSNGAGGAGVVWTIKKGSWNSTWSNNGGPISAVKQAPRNAVMAAGTYDWAISVRPLGDGSNEIRWKMIKTDNKYWFGGIAIDTAEVSAQFNGICFGFNKDIEATSVDLYEVKVDIGTPITIPPAPWESYYVTDWGFSGGNLGGWDFVKGEFDGDAEISGTAAPTGWAAVRGAFETYVLDATNALKLSGQIELVGGGFQNLGSLRYGLFYSDSAGTTWQDSTLDSNWVWKGTDRAHSGYLITPPSGSNVASWVDGNGTWGSITNGKWWNISNATAHVLGNPAQVPAGGVAGAGVYDFAISISSGTGGNVVVFALNKVGGGYSFVKTTTTPVTSSTDKFNSIGFAINNSTTTALKLYGVKVDRGVHFTDVEEKETPQLPKVFALKQNYPNPFNPTTNIRFDLPKNSDVSLVVYDLMGREVAQLVKGHLDAGYHTINFNAAKLPSGVYIYRLIAGDFVSVKKLMLLK